MTCGRHDVIDQTNLGDLALSPISTKTGARPAAHTFWESNQLKHPNETHFLRLSKETDGNAVYQKMLSVETVGTKNPYDDRNADKDWAVMIIEPNPGVNPFKLPPEDFALSRLKKNDELVSVGYHRDLVTKGALGRRITDCDFDVEWDPYWSSKQIGIKQGDLLLNSCSLFDASSGSAITPSTGRYAHTIVALNIGGIDKNANRASKEVNNFSVPVKGAFREAIINACNKCMGSEDWKKDYLMN